MALRERGKRAAEGQQLQQDGVHRLRSPGGGAGQTKHGDIGRTRDPSPAAASDVAVPEIHLPGGTPSFFCRFDRPRNSAKFRVIAANEKYVSRQCPQRRQQRCGAELVSVPLSSGGMLALLW